MQERAAEPRDWHFGGGGVERSAQGCGGQARAVPSGKSQRKKAVRVTNCYRRPENILAGKTVTLASRKLEQWS